MRSETPDGFDSAATTVGEGKKRRVCERYAQEVIQSRVVAPCKLFPTAITARHLLWQKNPRGQEGTAGCLIGQSCYGITDE